MKMIETTVVVGADHTITLQLPPEIAPADHQVVVIEAAAKECAFRPPLRFSANPVGLVDDAFTFRWEDRADDDGR